MVTFMSEEVLQKLRTIAANRDCSLEDALHIAIDELLATQYEAADLSNGSRRRVEIPEDLRRMLDESA